MQKLTGKIIFETFAAGTKSESRRPYLCFENGTKILLYKKNENPFENNGFTEYGGKKVTVEGELENGIFCVELIELIEENSVPEIQEKI